MRIIVGKTFYRETVGKDFFLILLYVPHNRECHEFLPIFHEVAKEYTE